MLETEFLFFQGMKKRIDQRISEGNYDEAAVSMQKCMEYILNSLDYGKSSSIPFLLA